MDHKVAAWATGLLAATLAITGSASAAPRVEDGLYAIQVYQSLGPDAGSRWGGCMIISNRGADTVPTLYHWGLPFNYWGECGLGAWPEAVLKNRQAAWRVNTVVGTDGSLAYVIKSAVTDQCLIRGHNGYAENPSLHSWSNLPGGDAAFCGFRSPDELLLNGQAAWSLKVVDVLGELGTIVTSASTNKPIVGHLGFSPNPPVFPNTADRHAWAVFSKDANPWWFFFVRMDP